MLLILPSNSRHLNNIIRYDEVNHGKIDDNTEEKALYLLLRCLSARSDLLTALALPQWLVNWAYIRVSFISGALRLSNNKIIGASLVEENAQLKRQLAEANEELTITKKTAVRWRLRTLRKP